jgi:alpha-L-arabinofuranosidase
MKQRNYRTAIGVVLLLLSIMNGLAASKVLKVEVKDQRMSETPVSKYIFGNFVEAGFGRQVSGMWSEMIYNRSFMLPGSYPKFGDVRSTTQWWMFPASMYNSNAPFWHSGYEENEWELTDTTVIQMSRTRGTESYKGLSSLLLTKPTDTKAGIWQRGIRLEAGREYQFYIMGGIREGGLRVSESLQGFTPLEAENVTRPFVMVLRDEQNPDHVLFRNEFQFCGYQEKYICDIPDLHFTGRAIMELTYDWKGNVALSCCSMMPKDNVYGWRKDVVELLKMIKVPVIRYPGGCYASFYNWRNYVGSRDTRETSSSFYWGGLDDNDASIDEFLQLCDEIDCEPQICINMMTGTPFKAAEFVEYLNGDDDTPMGRFRLENGVMRKRKVRFFEMDNEAGRKWTALQYAGQVVDYAKAMKAVDPDIRIMMMIYSFDHEMEYLEQMLHIAGQSIDHVIHRNGSPDFVYKILQILKKFNQANGTNIRLTNTEWLAGGSSPEPFPDEEIPQRFGWKPQLQDNYKKVLSFRQIHWFYALNGAAKLLDYLSYGGDYYLANFNNCVNTWGQNVIEASGEGAWLSPMGEVFYFFSSQEDTYPVQTQLHGDNHEETGSKIENEVFNDPDVEFPLIVNRQSQSDLFKVTACETNGGMNIYFVNKSTEPVELQCVLPKGYYVEKIIDLYAPDRLSRTYLGHSDIKKDERRLGNPKRIEIRPLSLNQIKVVKKDFKH